MLKGLTLFEGLVFGGILAVVVFGTGFATAAARERARDYKRLADVVRIQSALEIYFNDKNSYPISASPVALGGEGAKCLDGTGLQAACPSSGRVYLNPIPGQTAIGLGGGLPKAYMYESDGENYVITLGIEHKIPEVGVEKGLVCARPGQNLAPAIGGKCGLK
ncbi:MAG: hypothetical protein AAB886_01130 [Patescibacteria group bacterium]